MQLLVYGMERYRMTKSAKGSLRGWNWVRGGVTGAESEAPCDGFEEGEPCYGVAEIGNAVGRVLREYCRWFNRFVVICNGLGNRLHEGDELTDRFNMSAM